MLNNMNKQKTIKNEIKISGIGIHSGLPSEVIFKPAPVNTGIVFYKKTPDKKIVIKSCVAFVIDTVNQVTLGNEERRIQTVEHLLSALYALEVSNCIIEVCTPEIPIMDGSAYPFVQAIKQGGIKEQNAEFKSIRIPHPIWVTDGDKYLVILPSEKQEFNFHISYSHPELENQSFYLPELNHEVYEEEVSKARTFGFYEDWEFLKSKNLANGASLDNTVVYDKDGRMNNTLRYKDEPVRHKMLDLIGDLSLLNARIYGRVLASKSGHKMDIELVKKIKKLILENRFTKKEIKENYKKFEKEVAFLL